MNNGHSHDQRNNLSGQMVVVDSPSRLDSDFADTCSLELGRLENMVQVSGTEWHGCGADDPVYVSSARRSLNSVYGNVRAKVIGPDVPRDLLGTVGALRSVLVACRALGPGDDKPVTVAFGNISASETRVTAPVYTEFAAARSFYGWAVRLAYKAIQAQAPTIQIRTANHNTVGGIPIDRNITLELLSFPNDGAVFTFFLYAACPITLGADGSSGTWAPFPGLFGGGSEDEGSSEVSVFGLAAGAGDMTVEWLHPDSIKAATGMVGASAGYRAG